MRSETKSRRSLGEGGKKTAILIAVFFVFCCASCANKNAAIAAYPDGYPESRVYLEGGKSYAESDYATQEIMIYNQTLQNWKVTVGCEWRDAGGNKLTSDTASKKVKSGTKAKVFLSGYYNKISVPQTLTIKCAIAKKKLF
jgi:hypothetical protein